MRRFVRPLVAIAMAALVAAPAAPALGAQPEPEPSATGTGATLLDALRRVPDTPAVRETLIGYVDFRAAEVARPGAATPASLAEHMALADAGDPSADLWLAAMSGISSGSPDLLLHLFGYGAEWPRLLGFDFFEVDHELAFGTPPGDGLVLLGDFDPAEVGRAFEARGYSGRTVGERTLWCGAVGCEGGLQVDIGMRDPANPFGGNLGRSEPLAVSAHDLLSSADMAMVEAMLMAAGGETPSLAQDPAYRGVAGALDPGTMLIQATLVPSGLITLDAGLRQPEVTIEPLPYWDLAAILDGATATEQVVTIVLAYADKVDGAVAAEAIPRRLSTLTWLEGEESLADLLVQRGVTSVTGRVLPPPDGATAVAVIELRAPLAGDQPDPTSGRLMPSSLLYRLFTDMLFRRDVLWLAPAPPSE